MIATLVASILTAAKPGFLIQNFGGHPYLIHGKDKLVLPTEVGNWEWLYSQEDLLGIRIAGGKNLRRISRKAEWELLDVALEENNIPEETLNFQNLGAQYLGEDHLWNGGHKTANDLRYLADRKFLGQLVVAPSPAKLALGTMYFQNTSASLQPVQREALVRIDTTPNLRATFLTDLGYVGDTLEIMSHGAPCVFLLHGRFWICAFDGLHSYDPKAGLGELIFPLAKGAYPVGQVADRFIAFRDGTAHELILWKPGFPAKHISTQTRKITCSEDSSLIALSDSILDPLTGKQFKLGENVLLWKDYAIQWDGMKATIYDGHTAKIVARLTVKKRPMPRHFSLVPR